MKSRRYKGMISLAKLDEEGGHGNLPPPPPPKINLRASRIGADERDNGDEVVVHTFEHPPRGSARRTRHFHGEDFDIKLHGVLSVAATALKEGKPLTNTGDLIDMLEVIPTDHAFFSPLSSLHKHISITLSRGGTINPTAATVALLEALAIGVNLLHANGGGNPFTP